LDITIRGRHVEITTGLRTAVDQKLTRLARHVEGMDRAEVCFSEERNPRIADKEVCEVTMVGHGHIVRAKASGAEPLAALDRVIDRLEGRLRRLKGKLTDRSHPRRTGSLDSRAGGVAQNDQSIGGHSLIPSDDDTDGEDAQPRIVKTKQFAIKPMTPEEASLQMDLLSHDFFFFTNADTGAAAVVYRRKDGDVGLIDAT
jgi:putative sigma-54 modulation protein